MPYLFGVHVHGESFQFDQLMDHVVICRFLSKLCFEDQPRKADAHLENIALVCGTVLIADMNIADEYLNVLNGSNHEFHEEAIVFVLSLLGCKPRINQ